MRWVGGRVRNDAHEAPGNRVTTKPETTDPAGSFRFDGLCLREPAWKLAVEVAPARPDSVRLDAVWHVPGFALPPAGRTVTLSRETELAGSRFRITRSLAGAVGQPAGPKPRMRYCTVSVDRTSGESGLTLTLTRVTDENGKECAAFPRHGTSARQPGGTSQFCHAPSDSVWFSFCVPADTRKVNLTFALHRTRRFEFLAAP